MLEKPSAVTRNNLSGLGPKETICDGHEGALDRGLSAIGTLL